jgi:hypothetical protein
VYFHNANLGEVKQSSLRRFDLVDEWVRPWLEFHEGAVQSSQFSITHIRILGTFHLILFDTSWGIKQIRGMARMARIALTWAIGEAHKRYS